MATATNKKSLFVRARKAFVAGAVAALAAGAASFATAAGTGKFTGSDALVVASFAVGAFGAAFAATYRAKNA